MKLEQIQLTISGRVQGVGFRYSARDEAINIGVTGWVRNLRDGSVELLAEGSSAKIDSILAWCHEGPPSSRVEAVTVMRRAIITRHEFSGFEIRRD